MKAKLLSTIALASLLSLFQTTLLAKGGEIKFTSTIISVSQSDSDIGSIEVAIHSVTVPIIINGDTELTEAGEEISLAELPAGAFVLIDSFFSDEGLVADEVEVVDKRDEQFRFRGEIDAVDLVAGNTVVTLLGVDVTLVDDTDITRRGRGSGNDIAATDLVVGDLVNVSGSLSEGSLVATRVHVGTREQGNIELEGDITSVADSQISITIDGGTELAVFFDENTSVVGELAEGVFVEAEGQLQADLSLLAFEIVTDEDGDGDADDDNRRGKRGDENSNIGRGNGNDDDDDDDDSSSDDDDSDSDSDSSDEIEVGAEIILAADGVEANGKVDYSYQQEGTEIEQELEIELEDADSDTAYTLVIFFGDTSVELGSFTTNSFGDLEVELRADSDSDDGSLGEFIPEGLDIRDLTRVQVLLNGEVILAGDFS
ncbi:MAG: hypothetical protein PsegKO_00290 [Pseudohongiellaceae bacterium]